MVTGLLLLVHLLQQYLLLRKMLLGHLLLGTICYCVIIATIVQMQLRIPKILKVVYDHNQYKQLRKSIDSVWYAHQKQKSKQHSTPVNSFSTLLNFLPVNRMTYLISMNG